jgi:hypothetical protein
MSEYFVINNWDGDTMVIPMSEAEVQKSLNEEGGLLNGVKFIDNTTGFDHDTNYWGDRLVMLIKGTIVTPKAVQRVTEWEI